MSQTRGESSSESIRPFASAVEAQYRPENLRGTDRVFGEVSRTVPGFAGRYYGEDGQLVVLVADPAQQSAATEALGTVADGHYTRRPDGSQRAIEFREVQFTFQELAAWRDLVRRELSADGVTGLDLDEHTNTVEVWVDDVSRASQVEDEMVALGLPAAAIRTKVEAPVVPHETLDDDGIVPRRGGIQAGTREVPDDGCTIGYNVLSDELGMLGTPGFIANSHCTDVQGGTQDTTKFWQATKDSGNLIGVELLDPLYEYCFFAGAWRLCRESDAAFIEYFDGVDFEVRKIARVTTGIQIDPDNPSRFIVDDALGSPAVGGTILRKTGSTTGDSWGTVGGDVCADILQTNFEGPTDVLFYCETRVNREPSLNSPIPMSDGGDSGSPVYSLLYGTASDVRLYGVLWGGPDDGTSFIYSDIDGIEEELGSMTTF